MHVDTYCPVLEHLLDFISVHGPRRSTKQSPQTTILVVGGFESGILWVTYGNLAHRTTSREKHLNV